MTDTTLMRSRSSGPIEMTTDPTFSRRIRRLILVSLVALGLISVLAVTSGYTGWAAIALLVGGWVTMPSLLARSLVRPQWRYLLAVPASAVSAGLVIIAAGFDGSAAARFGWWLMAAGVLTGGTLGGWFWYRWGPVPASLDEPFSTGRWVLVAVHAGLVVAGGLLVAFSELL